MESRLANLMNLRLASAAPLLAALLVPAAASAQVSDADRLTARELGQEGHHALDRQDWATAADRFRRADALIHAPTFLLGVAEAQVGLGQLVGALETYNRIVREGLPPQPPAAFVKAFDLARAELDRLAPRVPYVIIELIGAGAHATWVTLDGAEVPRAAIGIRRAVDPGKHVIRAVVEGFAPIEATLTSVERAMEKVTLEPKPMAAPAPAASPGPAVPVRDPWPEAKPAAAPGSTQRTLGIVGLTAGGAGVVVGAVLGGLVIARHGDILKQCPGGICPLSQQTMLASRIDGYHALSAGSTAGFIAGGALAVTGAVLFFTAPKATPASGGARPWRTVQPVLGLAYAGAEGSF